MAITLQNVADAVGVTKATVSNAMNHRGKMSPETREKVLKVAEELGYAPNRNARNLVVSKSRMIGIVVPDLENPFYGRLVKQITALCKDEGYQTIIADSFESSQSEEEAIRWMVSGQVEGVLIAPPNYGIPSNNFIPILEKNNVKYCFVTNKIPKKDYPYVMTDLGKGTLRLVDHLIKMGRRKICFLVGKSDNPISLLRLEGYKKAFALYDIPFDPACLIYCNTYDYETGYAKTEQLLKSSAEVDAVIALNDFMAVGALAALVDKGIRVPEQIAVAGYDNMFFSRISRVPLTTVEQDIDKISRLGVHLLIQMIREDRIINTSYHLEPALLIRESTDMQGPCSSLCR